MVSLMTGCHIVSGLELGIRNPQRLGSIFQRVYNRKRRRSQRHRSFRPPCYHTFWKPHELLRFERVASTDKSESNAYLGGNTSAEIRTPLGNKFQAYRAVACGATQMSSAIMKLTAEGGVVRDKLCTQLANTQELL